MSCDICELPSIRYSYCKSRIFAALNFHRNSLTEHSCLFAVSANSYTTILLEKTKGKSSCCLGCPNYLGHIFTSRHAGKMQLFWLFCDYLKIAKNAEISGLRVNSSSETIIHFKSVWHKGIDIHAHLQIYLIAWYNIPRVHGWRLPLWSNQFLWCSIHGMQCPLSSLLHRLAVKFIAWLVFDPVFAINLSQGFTQSSILKCCHSGCQEHTQHARNHSVCLTNRPIFLKKTKKVGTNLGCYIDCTHLDKLCAKSSAVPWSCHHLLFSICFHNMPSGLTVGVLSNFYLRKV